MTYNVFGGTLHLAQSVSVISHVTVLLRYLTSVVPKISVSV